MQKTALKPQDVCVLLQLSLTPRATYRELAKATGMSLGFVHDSSMRLEASGLALRDEGSVNGHGAFEFVSCGVPYAFPAEVGSSTRGVVTAFTDSMPSDPDRPEGQYVWPHARGNLRGQSLQPLCSTAVEISASNPLLYRLLAEVDAIRVGRARDREAARSSLRAALLDGVPLPSIP